MGNKSVLRSVIDTPCCKFYDTGVTHPDLRLLSRVAKVAHARHGWRFHMVRDELDEPVWRVYIADEKPRRTRFSQEANRRGPIQKFREIMNELAKK